MNSKRKGKMGELEAAKVLRDLGFSEVRRTAQYNGKETGSLADLIGIDGVHIEVKRNEHLNIHDAIDQAIRDRNEGETPIVMHRKNGKPWLVTMTVSDWATRERAWQRHVNYEKARGRCKDCKHVEKYNKFDAFEYGYKCHKVLQAVEPECWCYEWEKKDDVPAVD